MRTCCPHPALRADLPASGEGWGNYICTERMAKTQSKVPDTQPHSTSSTYQSLARPAQRRIASIVAIQMWHDLTGLMRPSANMLEKFTIQNWSSSTCSHACVCSPRTLSSDSVNDFTT